MTTTIFTIIAACIGVIIVPLLFLKNRKRLIHGRLPIDIDFDHAKRMENKSR